MRHNQQIVIEQPVDRVVELFDSSENMKEWFPGFIGMEPISGEPGQVGSTSRMSFKSGKNTIEMIETITVRNFPDEFSGEYVVIGKGIVNRMTNRFIPVDANTTRYEAVTDYEFSGLGMRLMSMFIGPMIKKQSYKTMRLFKEFAERQPTAAEA